MTETSPSGEYSYYQEMINLLEEKIGSLVTIIDFTQMMIRRYDFLLRDAVGTEKQEFEVKKQELLQKLGEYTKELNLAYEEHEKIVREDAKIVEIMAENDKKRKAGQVDIH